MKKQVHILLGSVILLALVAACSPDNKKKIDDGEMWYGGKPQPPISVKADYNRVIDGSGSFVLRLTPGADCSNLTTSLHGVNGVEVIGGDQISHGSCSNGGEVSRPTTVTVPAQQSGRVVATVSFVTRGQPLTVTKSFFVKAPGGERKLKTPGKVIQTKSGEKMVIMQGNK